MNLIDVAERRYATKVFESNKIIPDEVFTQIKALLRLSPSSVNSQPWHFIIAKSADAKKRLSRGTQGRFSSNESKVLNASHVILFCAKTQIDDAYLEQLLANEEKDGRFPETAAKDMVKNVRAMYVNMHRYELKDAQHWMEKQLYLNMGTILLAAGVLGVDAVPIEGCDANELNEEFGLLQKGYTAVAMIALGYHSEDDFNAVLPKSRFPEDELFTELA